MQNQFNWPLWHWHFEASSICTLHCPRCPRTEIPSSLVQTQLNLDFFKNNFNLPNLIKKITFCGDDGDPIYCRDLIDVVNFFKKNNPMVNITIITNGSYKDKNWWKELAKVLNSQDEVRFSIDGWNHESNNQYRVNSDWESIRDGIFMLRKNTDAIMWWDAIVFKFNQHKINDMKFLAEQWGFDNFQLTKSTKFGSKYQNYLDDGQDNLEPESEFISKTHRFEREIISLTGRKINNEEIIKTNLEYFYNIKNQFSNVIPLCFIGTKGLFVNSQGYLIPCCWIGNRYNHTGLEKFLIPENNIKFNGLESVLNNPNWKYFIEEFEYMKECKQKCISNLVTEEYATNW